MSRSVIFEAPAPPADAPGPGDPALRPVGREEGLTAKVYRQLRGALMRGHMRPEQRLVHRTIAAELQVSPTPVREAVLRLASEGALALDARGIAYVPTPEPERYAEILALRVELEGRAAARAADRAGPPDIRRLGRTHAKLAEAKRAGDWEAVLSENESFHSGIMELAAMPVLSRLVESLWMQCGPTIRLRYAQPDPTPPERHPHLALLAALERRDPEGARAAMAEDLEANGRVILRQLGHTAEPPSEVDLAHTAGRSTDRSSRVS